MNVLEKLVEKRGNRNPGNWSQTDWSDPSRKKVIWDYGDGTAFSVCTDTGVCVSVEGTGSRVNYTIYIFKNTACVNREFPLYCRWLFIHQVLWLLSFFFTVFYSTRFTMCLCVACPYWFSYRCRTLPQNLFCGKVQQLCHVTQAWLLLTWLITQCSKA